MKDSMDPVKTFWDGDASSAEKLLMRSYWRIVRRGRAGRVGDEGENVVPDAILPWQTGIF